MALKRKKLGKRFSRKLFRRSAKRFHKKNILRYPMRGGIRF